MGGLWRPGRGRAVTKNESLWMSAARNWVMDSRKLGIGRFRRYLQPQSLVSCKQPSAGEDLEGVALEFLVSDKWSSCWRFGHGAGLLVTVLVLATVVVAFETCSNLDESPGCSAGLLLGRLSELGARSYGAVSAGGSGYAYGPGLVPEREGAEEARWLLRQLEKNGTGSCDKESTSRVMLFGMPPPQPGQPVQLRAGLIHELLLVSYTDNGTRRCGGGDYYETALEGGGWRSRPPLVDVGDGSYLLRLGVAEGITGGFVFKLVMLFGNYHGVERGPDKWVLDKELLSFDIEFVAPPQQQPQQHRRHGGPSMELNQCSVSGGDFKLREWKGRWTRTAHNDSCTQPDEEGRYRCLPSDAPCDSAWCDGPVGSIDSNGWAYSAHCKFRIFQQEEAWSCLGSKWLLFWGDSNHQDTTRNLLNLVLGLDVGSKMNRSYDTDFPDPANSSQSLRITSIFAGHFNDARNYKGVSSLRNDTYLHRIQGHFTGDRVPDAVVLNSGLHDGFWWRNVIEYAEGADFAARFWAGLWKNVTARGDSRAPPKVIYRTTVAPAGKSRSMNSNPQKMEAWNTIMVDRMLATGIPVQVVDAFDMTFPWHFDNNCSDGGHYGRLPSLKPWFGQIGHQYFVDLMVVHVLLNALCPLV